MPSTTGLNAGQLNIVWHAPVKAATIAPLPPYTAAGGTITLNANGAFPSIDGVALSAANGDRFLLRNGASPADNGIYVLTTQGSATTAAVATRAEDADTSADVAAGLVVPVGSDGASLAGSVWYAATPSAGFTLGTSPLSFSRIDSAGIVPRQETLAPQLLALLTDTILTGTLQFPPSAPLGVQLYLNGQLRQQGAGKDYVLTGATNQQVNWLRASGTAPPLLLTDRIAVSYTSAV